MKAKHWMGVLLFGSFLWASCSQNEICLSNQHALQSGFYSALALEDKDTLLTEARVYGILPEKDPLYDNETVGKLFLPLSFQKDTTAFVLYSGEFMKDTLWFRHSSELKYISRECGFTFNFELDSVWFTSVFIDSVAIENPGVNYGENFENVKIYIY
jgi:hypothetical protein